MGESLQLAWWLLCYIFLWVMYAQCSKPTVTSFATTLSWISVFTQFKQIETFFSWCVESALSRSHISGHFLFPPLPKHGIKIFSPQIKRIFTAILVWAQLDYSFSCSCPYLWYNEEFPKDLQSYSDPAGSSSKNLSFLPLLGAHNKTDVLIKCLQLCYW